MRRRISRWIAVPLFATALAVSTNGQAQTAAGPTAGGQTAGGWSATATAQGNAELKLDAKQAEAVKQVSAYFNTLKQMKGTFVQTDPDKKRTRGRFYVQKPGKFRFDYSAPSRKIMASDGKLLRIKEPDQSNEDAVELDNTPFRLLLKANVDLLRDATILDVQESDDIVIVALQDKSPDAPGRVQLIFTKKPAFDLKEWVVRDPQGLETKVEVSELNKTDAVDSQLFVWDQGNVFDKK